MKVSTTFAKKWHRRLKGDEDLYRGVYEKFMKEAMEGLKRGLERTVKHLWLQEASIQDAGMLISKAHYVKEKAENQQSIY